MEARKWLAVALCAFSAAAAARIDPAPRAAAPQPPQVAAASAYRLALDYSSGNGVARDRLQAIAWLRKAAVLGHAEAQYRLAAVYAHGAYGVRRSEAIATRWLMRSAEHGFPEAQYALGLRYAEGRGVRRDAAKALAWVARAARNGHAEAAEAIRRAQASFLHR